MVCVVGWILFPQIHVLMSQPLVTQNLTVFGSKVFKELIELKWAIRMGSKPNMTSVLTRRERCQGCVCTVGEHVMRQQENSHMQATGRGLRRNQHSSHILLDVEPLELWESKFVLCKPPVCGTLAARAD